ncbi:TPA: hypothetical protein ACXNG6_000164 [Stenotrophomonas maltophilia]
MKINIFEGSRRIAMILAALAAVVTISLLVTNKPYVTANYMVSVPGQKPVWTEKSCQTDSSAMEFLDAETLSGKKVYVSLCLHSREFSSPDGGETRMFVPYMIDANGNMWGNEKYSPEVRAYAERLGKEFKFGPDDSRLADGKYSQQRYKEMGMGALMLIISLLLFWVGVYAIGWIVRGFAGIPRGQDFRPRDGQ